MKRAFTSPTATRWAFAMVIVLVVAQVLWWLTFQHRYIERVTAETLAAWERELALANALVASGDEAHVAQTIAQLSASHPHLLFNGSAFELDRRQVSAFEREQARFLRMFASEGPFFLLVVLAGLFIIARSLRSEQEMKRRQDNFLSAVGHEFRTPISTMKLLVETARYRPLSPDKQRGYLEAMQRELARLESTSERVLASARLGERREPPVLEANELNAVVQGLVEKARAGLEARGAVLEIVYSSEALPVSLDPAAFGVVLDNLLDNAVKYSPQEVKPIRVRLESKNHLVLLHVEDEGVGFSQEEAGTLFEKFYRAGSELTRETSGLGLGLYLVKSITEAMNGWVRAEALENGSRFTIVLPRRAEAPEARVLEPAS
jgi:two-component system, OmpR family, sensor histidine kinase SenX3